MSFWFKLKFCMMTEHKNQAGCWERYFNNTASAPTFCDIFGPRLEKGWRSTADRVEWA